MPILLVQGQHMVIIPIPGQQVYYQWRIPQAAQRRGSKQRSIEAMGDALAQGARRTTISHFCTVGQFIQVVIAIGEDLQDQWFASIARQHSLCSSS
jgi:hypothetical protein